ncbi:MAG TPA: S53 family peptidase [Terriglobales bacterium]|nr:S53 family peptidase [Terriglobales bacterium]
MATIFGLIVAAVAAQAATPENRITQTLNVNQWSALKRNVHPLARQEFDRGRTPGDEQISGSVVFRLSPAQQADLNALLAAQQNPSAPQYRQWLTPEQYAERFGLSRGDLAKISAWLQSEGLTVTRLARGGTSIFFTTTAAQAERAFHTELHNYLVNGQMRYANASAPGVPEALASVVMGIRGLNNFRPKAHLSRIRNVHPAPNFTSATTGNHFLAAEDFATIYNVKGLYDAGFDGTGQKLAIVGQTAINLSDTEAFRTASGLAKNDPQLLLLPGSGTSTTCSGDVDEANLDVEWSGAVAKNASVVFVYVGVDKGKTCNTTSQSVFDSLQYAIDNNVAPVVSTSYGFCETGLGATTLDAMQSWVQQGNAQGQTIMAASGDDGAADCDGGTPTNPSTSATQGLMVDAPASIPEVTGVGGTEFSGDKSSPATYWKTTNDASNGSAISYIPETSWNDTAFDISNGGTFSASGGGASSIFSKPTWQTGAGVPKDGKRDVPDVALNASADHDGYLLCSQGNCTNGFRNSAGNLSLVGGTSVGAPTFAGIVTLINQATASSGLGNINPTLYNLAASTPAAFHDITTGNNDVPCTVGTPDCTASSGAALVSSPFSLALATGQTSGSSLTVTGGNGFSGAVNLSCASRNPNVRCQILPATVVLDPTKPSASALLKISSVSASTSRKMAEGGSNPFRWIGGAAGLGLVSVMLVGDPSRRRGTMLMMCLAVFLSLGIGCGGGSSSTRSITTPTPPPSNPGSGTLGFSAGAGYDQVTGLGSVDALQLAMAWPGFSNGNAVTVTASSGKFSRTMTVALDVQPGVAQR